MRKKFVDRKKKGCIILPVALERGKRLRELRPQKTMQQAEKQYYSEYIDRVRLQMRREFLFLLLRPDESNVFRGWGINL